MKKTLLVLGILAGLGLAGFMGEALAKYTPPVKLPGEVLTGKVDAMGEQYTPQGKTQQVVTIRDSDGLQTVFVMAPDATIKDKSGSSTSLGWLKGNQVTVRYLLGTDGHTKIIQSVQEV